MNGTALRKPTARRVVGMVAASSSSPWHCAFQAVPPRQRLHQRPEHAAGGAARHLAGTQNLCTNILFFLLEFWFGRKYIGLGTFVNGICIGYIVTAFYDPIHAHFGDAPSLAVQLAWVIAAVLVTALGASLYQTADLGIAPYDYLSLGLRDYTPCPYFGCRIFTDALSALLCWLLGGLVGLGTLICAFCLGPFIQFFDRTFSQKVLQYKPNN